MMSNCPGSSRCQLVPELQELQPGHFAVVLLGHLRGRRTPERLPAAQRQVLQHREPEVVGPRQIAALGVALEELGGRGQVLADGNLPFVAVDVERCMPQWAAARSLLRLTTSAELVVSFVESALALSRSAVKAALSPFGSFDHARDAQRHALGRRGQQLLDGRQELRQRILRASSLRPRSCALLLLAILGRRLEQAPRIRPG